MTEEIITDFSFIESIENYDKANNQSRYNVFELAPRGIKWKFNKKEYKIINENKINAIVIDKKYIAIVTGFNDDNFNEAYIVNGDNTTKYNLKELIINKKIALNNGTFVEKVTFWDTYFIEKKLYFIIDINHYDFRFTFDVETGKIGELAFTK